MKCSIWLIGVLAAGAGIGCIGADGDEKVGSEASGWHLGRAPRGPNQGPQVFQWREMAVTPGGQVLLDRGGQFQVPFGGPYNVPIQRAPQPGMDLQLDQIVIPPEPAPAPQENLPPGQQVGNLPRAENMATFNLIVGNTSSGYESVGIEVSVDGITVVSGGFPRVPVGTDIWSPPWKQFYLEAEADAIHNVVVKTTKSAGAWESLYVPAQGMNVLVYFKGAPNKPSEAGINAQPL